MKRVKFDRAACDTLSDCVKEIESSTAAEVVVVVRARSGDYVYADLLFGAAISLLGLLFLLFSPYTFHQVWVAIDVVLLFALGSAISNRTSGIRRLLTSNKLRAGNVRTAAAAMFYEAGVANTNAELGFLVYLSLFERRLEVISDRGILKAFPPAAWNEALFDLHQAGRDPDVATFLQALKTLGDSLSKYLPATADNPDELPNLPHFEFK